MQIKLKIYPFSFSFLFSAFMNFYVLYHLAWVMWLRTFDKAQLNNFNPAFLFFQIFFMDWIANKDKNRRLSLIFFALFLLHWYEMDYGCIWAGIMLAIGEFCQHHTSLFFFFWKKIIILELSFRHTIRTGETVLYDYLKLKTRAVGSLTIKGKRATFFRCLTFLGSTFLISEFSHSWVSFIASSSSSLSSSSLS